MVTRIRAKSLRRRYLYIREWMQQRGYSDEKLAQRLEVDRVTVTRWRNEQHRLNPEKIAGIALALDLAPEDLWRPPAEQISRPSVDALLKNAPDDLVQSAAEMAAILLKSRA